MKFFNKIFFLLIRLFWSFEWNEQERNPSHQMLIFCNLQKASKIPNFENKNQSKWYLDSPPIRNIFRCNKWILFDWLPLQLVNSFLSGFRVKSIDANKTLKFIVIFMEIQFLCNAHKKFNIIPKKISTFLSNWIPKPLKAYFMNEQLRRKLMKLIHQFFKYSLTKKYAVIKIKIK